MGCAILEQEYDADRQRYERACFYNDTTDWAFGPVTDDLRRFSSPREVLLAFEAALGIDPRSIRSQKALETLWDAWSTAAREGLDEHLTVMAEDVLSEPLPDGGWRVSITPQLRSLMDEHP